MVLDLDTQVDVTDAAEEGADATKVVNAKMMFSMPAGDSGMIRKSTTVRIAPDKTSYSVGINSSDTIKFTVASSGRYIDPAESYFVLRIKDAKASPVSKSDTYFYMPIGAQGLIKRVVVRSWNGTAMEDLQDYNMLAAIVDRTTLTPDDLERWGCHEGYLPVRAGVLPYVSVLGPNDTTIGGLLGRMSGYNASFLQGMFVSFKLRHSGIFGSAKFIPLPQMGSLSVELELDTVDNAFSSFVTMAQAGFTNDSAAAIAASIASQHLVLANADPSTTAQVIQPSAFFTSGFTIDKVELVLKLVTLSPPMVQSLEGAIAGGGLPLKITTYSKQSHPITASSTYKPSFTVQKAVANAISVFSVQVSTATADVALGGHKFRFWQGGLQGWQYRLGVEYFPQQKVDNMAMSVREAVKALPGQPGRAPAIPRVKYSWNGPSFTQFPATDSKAVSDHTVTDVYTNAARFADFDNQPDLFIIGAPLQRIRGIELSGESTNAGNQLTLECDFSSADPWGNSSLDTNLAASSRYTAARDMHTFLLHTRIIVIGPSQNVAIKE